MGKEALVVKRDTLFSKHYFDGFLPTHNHDFMPLILKNFEYHPRGDALETNEALKQIIPYVWIVNPTTKHVFAYRRANNKNYSEVRLRNKWSCGLGGHVERQDNGNPIESAMMRELREEVVMQSYPIPRVVGYLNDDQEPVGKVHFGIVAIVETTHSVEKGDDEMAEGKLMSISEFEALSKDPNNEIERWTQLSWPFVKQYLSNI